MRTLLFLFALCLFQQGFSQEYVPMFGDISPKEISMNSYDKDRTAEAVVLFDVGKSEFVDVEGGYEISFVRHKRIKIFKKSAIDYAEISIPFYVDGYGKTEKIASIQAVTYNNENGYLRKQILDPSTIYEEKINQRWRNLKFVFPNVQEGSIIEFKYELRTPFHFNLPDWEFQSKIPTMYSEYQVRLIPFYEYRFIAQGISRFHHQTSVLDKTKRSWGDVSKSYGQNVGNGIEFQDYIHTYALKDVPAFKDESYITSINDYIIKIDFQLAKFHHPSGGSREIMSTWPKLNKELLKNDYFGKYIKNCKKIAKKILAEEIDIAGKTENEKSKIIIDYVKKNFTWNGFNGKYTSKTAKEFFNQKNGNIADINLFLIGLLNSADIEAVPVILSTRSHGKLRVEYPFDHFTNYVIALVNTDSQFLADASEDMLPFNKIPTRCINERGLIVDNSDESNWINLANNSSSVEKNMITIDINPDDIQANVGISVQTTGYNALYYRNKFEDNSDLIQSYYSERIGEIGKIKTFNYENIVAPYSIALNGKCELEQIENTFILYPFLNLPIQTNELTQKERNYPVDLIYARKEEFDIRIKVPENFKLGELPEAYKMDNELASIELDYSLNNNSLRILGHYNFKKAVYDPKEYSRIKFYIRTIVKEFNKGLVFEKL